MKNNVIMKSKGLSKSYVNIDGKKHKHDVIWDANADYDGEKANISLDIQENKDKKHYDLQLNNNDLEKLLNISSIDIPLEKRIKNDFFLNNKNNHAINRHKYLFVYLDDIDDENNIHNINTIIPYNNSENYIEKRTNKTNKNNIKKYKTRNKIVTYKKNNKLSKKKSKKNMINRVNNTSIKRNKRRSKKQKINLLNEFGNAIMYR